MKLSQFTSAVVVSLFATSAFAQTTEQINKDLEAVKADLARTKAELSAMKAEKSESVREEAVESEINRLSERAAAATTVNSGANKITFTGEFRYRSYLTFGDQFGVGAADHDGWHNSSRVRLGFGYDFSRDVSAFAELQSEFAFGQNEFTSTADSTAVSLAQAWVKTTNLFGVNGFSAKIGRQAVTLGNQFHFGNADWYSGVFFDGGRWEYENDSMRLTGLVLRTATADANDVNQTPAFNQLHNHDEIYSAYFTLKSIKNAELDLYWIYANIHIDASNNSFNGPGSSLTASTDYYHTIGARFGGTADVAAGMDYNAEVAYQTGSTTTPMDISALAIEGELGLTFNKDNKIRAWLRGLFSEGADGNDLAFQPLYPNRHSNTANFRARYGVFDIFPMADIFALTGGLHFDPAKDWTIGANLVWGERESNVAAPVDESYGFEIDLWAEYRYSEAMTFGFGAAILFPDDQLENVANNINDEQVLFYMQARLLF